MMNKTNQREAILRELRMLKSHPTADELYSVLKHKVPQISLGTIYRNLEQMSRSGMISKLEMAGRQMRFDGNPRPHDHVRCSGCNWIDNIECNELTALHRELQALLPKIRCDAYRLEFFGTCDSCGVDEAPCQELELEIAEG